MTGEVKIPDSLPWTTDLDLPYAKQPRIEAADGRNIAVVGNSQNELQDTWESDAAYIVHAANAYPALVEALREILAWDARRGHPIPYRQRDPAVAALQAAGVKI